MMKSLILFCAVLTIGGLAYADSDGYFCSSPKFLAYEFSFSKEPGNQHRLYVVRFGQAFSASTLSIQIPDFQVHGMRCTDTEVELFGWDKKYLFTVSATALISADEVKLPAPGVYPADLRGPENLGGESPVARGAMPREFTFKLETLDPVYKYELRIKRLDTKNRWEILVTTNLVKLDEKGEVREVLPIYKNKVPIESGE
jgi:hypothetical protein